MICALGLHNVILITITVTLLPTSAETCSRLSSHAFCTTLRRVTTQQTSCLQFPAFARLIKAVQQFTRISNRRISSYEEGFGILKIPVSFALRSLLCCVRTVPSRAKPFGPLQRFSQWLLNNPAFSAITCSTAYLGTWKVQVEQQSNQMLSPGQSEQTLPNQWCHHG